MTRPGVGFIPQPHHVEQFVSPLDGLFTAQLFVGDGRLNQVLQHRQVREEVEVLEHVADIDPLFEDRLLFQLIQRVALPAIADVIPVNLDKAFVNALQMVDGAQQGRFARARWPEDHRYRAGRDLQRDVIQRLVAAKELAHTGNGNMSFRRGWHGRAPVWLGW